MEKLPTSDRDQQIRAIIADALELETGRIQDHFSFLDLCVESVEKDGEKDGVGSDGLWHSGVTSVLVIITLEDELEINFTEEEAENIKTIGELVSLAKSKLGVTTSPSTSNSIQVIAPYWYQGTWVFDDQRAGLIREPFVSGADQILSKLVETLKIPNASEGFLLYFSDQPFPDHQLTGRWVREESWGNWYQTEDGQEGWLCPALFHYFDSAPKELYLKAEPRKNPSSSKATPSLSTHHEIEQSDERTSQGNSIQLIVPYWWDGAWVFDDDSVDLVREPFVSGADDILSNLVTQLKIDNPEAGFRLYFSDQPFPGSQLTGTWTHAESNGNWYRTEDGQEGWLCPALMKYFDVVPKAIYIQVLPKN